MGDQCFISENVSHYLANFELSRQTILGSPEGRNQDCCVLIVGCLSRATCTTEGVQVHGEVEELADPIDCGQATRLQSSD